MRELFLEIWSSLRQNKLRTALTGLAVAWGIFLLIALLGAGNGLLNALLSNSSGMDMSMNVMAGRTSKPYNGFEKGRRVRFDVEDVERLGLEPFSEYVDDVSPLVSQRLTMVYGDYYVSCNMMGVEPAYQSIQRIRMVKGRFLNPADEKELRKVVVIDKNNAIQLHGAEDGYEKMIGEYVRIGGFPYMVIGITASEEDNSVAQVYVPYATASAIYNKGNDIREVSFSFHGIETPEESEVLANSYRRSINRHHDYAPDDRNTAWISNRLANGGQVNKAIRTIRLALWILGLMSLISGIVGVSNIMLITVKERTREFGIRKAIGARPSSILWLIIAESVSITTVFGYLGMVLGMAANELMDKTMGGHQIDAGFIQMTMFLNPKVGLDVAMEATLVLIIAGTLAGMIPAMKAARVKPIEALRG